jgi:hypothetical protein
MSTQFGIVRFDGTGVKVFNTENVQGLSSDRIRLGAKSFEGNIYFVDENYRIIKVASPNHVLALQEEDEQTRLYGSSGDFLNLPPGNTSTLQRLGRLLNWNHKEELVNLYTVGNAEAYIFYHGKANLRICYYHNGRFYQKALDHSLKALPHDWPQ